MHTRPSLLASITLTVIPFAVARAAFAEPQIKAATPSIASQAEASRELPMIAPQSAPSPNAMLELEPQPREAKAPEIDQLPVDRIFKQAQAESAPKPETAAHQSGTIRRPYLGIRVQYTTKCYLGMEENGLEVISVYPGGPGSVGGLKGMTPVSPLGVVGGALLGPIAGLLEPTGAFGMDGDLIVAVDDERVRSKDDLDAAMLKLKPGDTMYLTIIRPLPGGNHKTMKIAVNIGRETFEVAASAPPPSKVSTPAPESEAENYVY
ncbi:MAG TPA: PDZ domain-containing protein [Candidatus Binataceae bacterium]|nr:PDZ domain-containing protein [Candidatus Binataceae bacterium]